MTTSFSVKIEATDNARVALFRASASFNHFALEQRFLLATADVVPVRLQLRRQAGFNLQALSRRTNGLPAANCARPGPYGNPFHTNDDSSPMLSELAAKLFRAQLLGDGWFINDRHHVVTVADIRRGLRWMNLACFCPLTSAWCHVDTLLEVANGY